MPLPARPPTATPTTACTAPCGRGDPASARIVVGDRMSIELSPDTEIRIAKAVETGMFSSPSELVETAVKDLLEQAGDSSGKFHALRKRLEQSGVPLLTNDQLPAEIRERRGRGG